MTVTTKLIDACHDKFAMMTVTTKLIDACHDKVAMMTVTTKLIDARHDVQLGRTTDVNRAPLLPPFHFYKKPSQK